MLQQIKHTINLQFIDLLCPTEKGGCANEDCRINPSDVIPLDNKDEENTLERQIECLNLCKSTDGATGCELVWGPGKKICYVHKQPVTQVKTSCANGEKDGCSGWIFNKCKKDITCMI